MASFEESIQFVQEMWTHDGASSEMHVGDVCWGVFHRSPPELHALRHWSVTGGPPQALTMYDGHGVCDLVVGPGRAGLDAAGLALDWAEDRCRDAAPTGEIPRLRVGRRVSREPIRQLLRRRGFVPMSSGFPAMHRSIGTDDRRDLVVPSGYELRSLGKDEIEQRVRAFDVAFAGDEITAEAYRRLQGCDAYIPALDVVAIAPDTSIAAFATLWLDRRNSVVQIEPAGCQPDHRRLGLTQAVILHGLAAAARLGATGAIVRPSSENPAARSLYDSCGFRVVSDGFGFVKTIARPA